MARHPLSVDAIYEALGIVRGISIDDYISKVLKSSVDVKQLCEQLQCTIDELDYFILHCSLKSISLLPICLADDLPQAERTITLSKIDTLDKIVSSSSAAGTIDAIIRLHKTNGMKVMIPPSIAKCDTSDIANVLIAISNHPSVFETPDATYATLIDRALQSNNFHIFKDIINADVLSDSELFDIFNDNVELLMVPPYSVANAMPDNVLVKLLRPNIDMLYMPSNAEFVRQLSDFVVEELST